MAAAVDEEGRRARDAALVGAGDVLADPCCEVATPELVDQALRVEPELVRVGGDVRRPQLALVGEQQCRASPRSVP